MLRRGLVDPARAVVAPRERAADVDEPRPARRERRSARRPRGRPRAAVRGQAPAREAPRRYRLGAVDDGVEPVVEAARADGRLGPRARRATAAPSGDRRSPATWTRGKRASSIAAEGRGGGITWASAPGDLADTWRDEGHMTAPGHQDDAALVAAARRGDRRAFAELVERHYPRLLRGCVRATGDPDAAADAAQEAVVAALLGLERLRRADRFGAWLVGIGLNLCRRRLREAARRAAGRCPTWPPTAPAPRTRSRSRSSPARRSSSRPRCSSARRCPKRSCPGRHRGARGARRCPHAGRRDARAAGGDRARTGGDGG